MILPDSSVSRTTDILTAINDVLETEYAVKSRGGSAKSASAPSYSGSVGAAQQKRIKAALSVPLQDAGRHIYVRFYVNA